MDTWLSCHVHRSPTWKLVDTGPGVHRLRDELLSELLWEGLVYPPLQYPKI